jgi:hypothetical protein
MSSETIIFEKMKEIVYKENRPFSFKDLESFSLNGQNFKFSRGHIRNISSKFRRKGLIELVCKSPQAFHTIKGVKFNNSMTPTCMTATPQLTNTQKAFLKFLRIHQLDHPSIHDIRLSFICEKLRSILVSSNSDLIKSIDDGSNKDVTLKKITLDDITLKITVHNTDRVTVSVACSDNPIPIDLFGVSRLTGALTTVKERLQRVIEDYNRSISNDEINGVRTDIKDCQIPDYMSWNVNMWHFGHDSTLEFTGPMFAHTWKESLDVFRIYSKKSRRKKEL